MKKWEYTVLVNMDAYQPDAAKLAGYGAEGWELVAVTGHGPTGAFIFKRPAEPAAEAENV